MLSITHGDAMLPLELTTNVQHELHITYVSICHLSCIQSVTTDAVVFSQKFYILTTRPLCMYGTQIYYLTAFVVFCAICGLLCNIIIVDIASMRMINCATLKIKV